MEENRTKLSLEESEAGEFVVGVRAQHFSHLCRDRFNAQ
jgi:hypothetical protein